MAKKNPSKKDYIALTADEVLNEAAVMGKSIVFDTNFLTLNYTYILRVIQTDIAMARTERYQIIKDAAELEKISQERGIKFFLGPSGNIIIR